MFQIFTDYPDISFHTYADDLQLYLNCTDSPLMPPTDSHPASIPYINGLLPTPLNLIPPKPKLFFSTYPRAYVPPPSLKHPTLLNMTTLLYYKHVRNLGLHIDSTISLDTQIFHMHKSIHYHLHCFSLI